MWNTGYKGYNKRRRKINGVLDGYEENNLPSGGLGPYIAPIIDYISCPTTSTTTTTITSSTSTTTTTITTTTTSSTTTTTTSSTTTTTTTVPNFIWIINTYTCEQTTPFVLVETISNFSSPMSIYWDDPSQRFVVVDVDDINGNIYTFNPASFTSYSDRTVIPGVVDKILCNDYDYANRKVWVAGDNTSGAKVVDLVTSTTTTVTYGTNGSFSRVLLKILGNTVYASSTTNVSLPSDMYLIDRITHTVTTKLNSSIPSGSQYFFKSFGINLVNSNEIWCFAAQRYNGNIAIYDSSLNTLNSTISLPSMAIITGWGFSQYWQAHYYDQDKNKWYVCDFGSNRWHVIDCVTKTVIKTTILNNRKGKLYSAFGFHSNPLTGDLYMSGTYMDSPSDTTQIKTTYRIDRDSYDYQYLYPNTQFNALSLRQGTNEVWGVLAGNVYTQPLTPWNTDGIISKYLA